MTNEYVFFGGKRIAMDTVSGGGGGTIGSTYYYAEDFLGSSRAMVQAGQTSACFDADFLAGAAALRRPCEGFILSLPKGAPLPALFTA